MKPKNRQGFTLIELSIVLVILGLIIGTVAPLIISITKKNKVSDGRKAVETARDELKGDFFQNRVLATDLSTIGHTIDPWKNGLVYIPAPNLVGQDLCTWLAAGTDQTGLAVCLEGDCTGNKKDNIAFVIASIGHNFNRQMEAPINLDGDNSDREIRIYGYGTEINRYTTAPDVNDATDQFDDIVQYVSVDELVQLISCSLVLRNKTGQPICSHGAIIDDDVDIGVINYNQRFSLGLSSDNCVTITPGTPCQLEYDNALIADSDKDGVIYLHFAPPNCTPSNDP